MQTNVSPQNDKLIQNIKIKTAHQNAIVASREYQKAEHILLEAIYQVDLLKVHDHLGFGSLFQYCLESLKLSEATAYNMIAVARKSKQVPELKAAIISGEMSVSTARKITPVITKENQEVWIEKAFTLTKAKLEKEVATVLPQTLVPERAKYVSNSRLELKLGVEEKTLQKLKRAQDLVSQKNKSAASYEQTLDVMLDLFLEKNDPIEKAKRNMHNSQSPELKSKIQSQAQSKVQLGFQSRSESHQIKPVLGQAGSSNQTDQSKQLLKQSYHQDRLKPNDPV